MSGTAGEALTAGQAVYLSDGSGSKAAGQWFKADAANGYSSTTAVVVGMVPASISSGSSGTIRLAGSLTGLVSLSTGSTYYIGTAGAITSTAPVNARKLGGADTATSLVLSLPAAPQPFDNSINDFRLTLTTAVPVTTADVTAATTIYCTPAGKGNRIALFDSVGTATILTSAEFSIAVPATTSQMYDVFAYNNAGVATLELLAWTNDTTRATAIVLTTTGSYTKTGDLTRRYLGSFRTTTVSGQTEDSVTKAYLWNYYNRAERPIFVYESTGNWNYTTNGWRQARATATNQLDIVVGVAEDVLRAQVAVAAFNGSASINVAVGIGEDSTTTTATGLQNTAVIPNNASYVPVTAALAKVPPVGRHYYPWLERSEATGTTTWYATTVVWEASGIMGVWKH